MPQQMRGRPIATPGASLAVPRGPGMPGPYAPPQRPAAPVAQPGGMTGSSGDAALAGGIAGAGGAIGQALTKKAEQKREQERYEDIKKERKRERDQELANQAAMMRITAAQARRQDAVRAIEATLEAKQAVLDGLFRDASTGLLGLPHEYMPLLRRELDSFLETARTPIKQGQLLDLSVKDGVIAPEWGPAGEVDPALADGARAFYTGLLAKGSAIADPQYRAAAAEKLANQVLPLVESIMERGEPGTYRRLTEGYYGFTGDLKDGVYRTGSMPDSYKDRIMLLDDAVKQLRERPDMIQGSSAEWLLDRTFPNEPGNSPIRRLLNSVGTGAASGLGPGEAAAGRQFLLAAASRIKDLLDNPPEDLPEGSQDRLLAAYREMLNYSTQLYPLERTLTQHGGAETMVRNIRAKLGTTGTAKEAYESTDRAARIAQYVEVYGPEEGMARWEAERSEGPPMPGSYDIFDMLSAEASVLDPFTSMVVRGAAAYKQPEFIASPAPAPEPAPPGAFGTGAQAGQKTGKAIGSAIDFATSTAGNAAVTGAQGIAQGAAGVAGFGAGLGGSLVPEPTDLGEYPEEDIIEAPVNPNYRP